MMRAYGEPSDERENSAELKAMIPRVSSANQRMTC